MVPHMAKAERKKIVDTYLKLIEDRNDEPTNAIIERDRARLRKLLSKK